MSIPILPLLRTNLTSKLVRLQGGGTRGLRSLVLAFCFFLPIDHAYLSVAVSLGGGGSSLRSVYRCFWSDRGLGVLVSEMFFLPPNHLFLPSTPVFSLLLGSGGDQGLSFYLHNFTTEREAFAIGSCRKACHAGWHTPNVPPPPTVLLFLLSNLASSLQETKLPQAKFTQMPSHDGPMPPSKQWLMSFTPGGILAFVFACFGLGVGFGTLIAWCGLVVSHARVFSSRLLRGDKEQKLSGRTHFIFRVGFLPIHAAFFFSR